MPTPQHAMPIEITQSPATNVVQVNLRGTLHADDYQHLVPAIERQIKQHGQLRLLVILDDFHGWDAGALWQDVKFDFQHHGDFRKIAIVGDSKWQEGMAIFCKPFTSAAVKFFQRDHLSVASNWLYKSGSEG